MTRCHCPVMSVITDVCFWVSAHSLKSLASFEAFPGLQTNVSWTMIIECRSYQNLLLCEHSAIDANKLNTRVRAYENSFQKISPTLVPSCSNQHQKARTTCSIGTQPLRPAVYGVKAPL